MTYRTINIYPIRVYSPLVESISSVVINFYTLEQVEKFIDIIPKHSYEILPHYNESYSIYELTKLKEYEIIDTQNSKSLTIDLDFGASELEKKLIVALKEANIPYIIQFKPFSNKKYVIDFAFIEGDTKIAIEADGFWHKHRKQYDAERDLYFSQNGWITLRFTEQEISHEIEKVIRTIQNEIIKSKSMERR
jgi:very-short-patch-repair endonuclease